MSTNLLKNRLASWLAVVAAAGLLGCATESHRTVAPEKPVCRGNDLRRPKSALMVGKFDDRSHYMQGVFSDGVDRLGSQAKTILIGHLQETGRF